MTDEFITAVTGGPFRFIVLVELATPSQTIRMTTDAVITRYDGDEYYPGLINSISNATSSGSVDESGISVSMSGLDSTLLSIVSASDFVNSECRVYLLAQEYLDNIADGYYTPPTCDNNTITCDNNTITCDAIRIYYKSEGVYLLFDGVVNSAPSLSFGGETSIDIPIQSRMVAKNRERSERYADADQQKKYPGDLGMQYATEVGKKTVRWPAASWFEDQ